MKTKNNKCIAIKFISESGFVPTLKNLSNIQIDRGKTIKKGKWILSKPSDLNLIFSKCLFGLIKPYGNIELRIITPSNKIEVNKEIFGIIDGITKVLRLIDKRKTKELIKISIFFIQ